MSRLDRALDLAERWVVVREREAEAYAGRLDFDRAQAPDDEPKDAVGGSCASILIHETGITESSERRHNAAMPGLRPTHPG